MEIQMAPGRERSTNKEERERKKTTTNGEIQFYVESITIN
jgi:hypothetical protein